jgi:hypothetical protein
MDARNLFEIEHEDLAVAAIRMVRAACWLASVTRFANTSPTATSILTLGRQSTTYRARG